MLTERVGPGVEWAGPATAHAQRPRLYPEIVRNADSAGLRHIRPDRECPGRTLLMTALPLMLRAGGSSGRARGTGFRQGTGSR